MNDIPQSIHLKSIKKMFRPYERHVETYNPELMYNCGICSKLFRRKYYLEYHMEMHNMNPYFCENCQRDGFGVNQTTVNINVSVYILQKNVV